MLCRRHKIEWCPTCLWLSRDELDALDHAGGDADAVAIMCEAIARVYPSGQIERERADEFSSR